MLYQLLRMQAEADGDGVIHLAHHLVVHPAHMLPQTLFVQCPDLLQQDHRIFGQAEAVGGQGDMVGRRAFPVWDVMAAAITVGLCLLPVSFWTMRTGRTPPCSLPTTGLRSA